MAPRPVAKAWRMPERPWMTPPVGRSGPGITRMISSSVTAGLSRRSRQASIVSPRWWGGMLVAMPTAMPMPPFTRRFGKRAGSTTGSLQLLS